MKADKNDRYRYYLCDLGALIKEYALDAKVQRSQQPDEEGRLLWDGKVLCYNQVISLMQQQARVFEIPLSELHIDDIEPDRDLI